MRMRLLSITILLLGAFPPPAAAQSPIAHVALLGASPVSDPAERPAWQAFVAALRERGWVEGHNLAFDLRVGGDHAVAIEQLGVRELEPARVELDRRGHGGL